MRVSIESLARAVTHRRRFIVLIAVAATLTVVAGPTPALAEDGHDLWLRYRLMEPSAQVRYTPHAMAIVAAPSSPTMRAAVTELETGLRGLLGRAVPTLADVDRGGALVLGTPESSTHVAALGSALRDLGAEGYVLRTVTLAGQPAIVIGANRDIGVLYGVFHFLRLLQTRESIEQLAIVSRPSIRYRVLNHWDNLDRRVERGYAGESLWNWHLLPDYLDPRYTIYARANASLGINGTVLTNVNADAEILKPAYLAKVATLAGVFRPYGIRVYLTARFSAPIEIGGLSTADPLDARVREWWRAKADEIYRLVPDFGGFLVKANSEGQPGPQDYGRSHADGANMLADAIGAQRGIVMWRAFVYSNEQPDDRAKQAYNEFVPLDGRFYRNVLLQVKNGPIDFQPREPFHPMFGAMPKTPLMMEFQITKEYLGFATHLVYLGAFWEEVLESDTQRGGVGSTVAKVIDGSLQGQTLTGMAGVANIGTDRNWCGSHFDQANWYAFGRLAWNPTGSARALAVEWLRMTFSNDPGFVAPAAELMMHSHQAVVDYMTPLGLHHLMGRDHHYGPAPWVAGGKRADWTSVYYHRADAVGVGFDRTPSGSNAVAQYAVPVAEKFGDLSRVPERFLLWFHHVSWDRRLKSGRTLWDELVVSYNRGVAQVGEMRKSWDALERFVDKERHDEVRQFLRIQEKEARWWRDASIAYFRTFSKQPLPRGYPEPEHSLEYYQSLEFPYAPGHID
jgi:alpha-glucuronidase